MFSHTDFSLSSSLLETTAVNDTFFPFTKNKKKIPVKLTTLDEFSKTHPSLIGPETLIKIDVQGYEDRVIKGGTKVFRNARVCVVEVSLDGLYKGQPSLIGWHHRIDDWPAVFYRELASTCREQSRRRFLQA